MADTILEVTGGETVTAKCQIKSETIQRRYWLTRIIPQNFADQHYFLALRIEIGNLS